MVSVRIEPFMGSASIGSGDGDPLTRPCRNQRFCVQVFHDESMDRLCIVRSVHDADRRMDMAVRLSKDGRRMTPSWIGVRLMVIPRIARESVSTATESCMKAFLGRQIRSQYRSLA